MRLLLFLPACQTRVELPQQADETVMNRLVPAERRSDAEKRRQEPGHYETRKYQAHLAPPFHNDSDGFRRHLYPRLIRRLRPLSGHVCGTGRVSAPRDSIQLLGLRSGWLAVVPRRLEDLKRFVPGRGWRSSRREEEHRRWRERSAGRQSSA